MTGKDFINETHPNLVDNWSHPADLLTYSQVSKMLEEYHQAKLKKLNKPNTYVIKFVLDKGDVDLLIKARDKGYLEYRDNYVNFKEFVKSYGKENLTDYQNENWFNKRNENQTINIAWKLVEYGMLTLVDDAWHVTYKLTNRGMNFLKEQNL